jgi:hypothetical protein
MTGWRFLLNLNVLSWIMKSVGVKKVHMLLGASIQVAMESMNLSKPLTANQTFDIVDNILDSCGEDYLGVEDVILFLQKMVRGETGNLFSAMDVPKFMQMFEKYRQERHVEYLRIKVHPQYGKIIRGYEKGFRRR